jgi:rare lipoprotein A
MRYLWIASLLCCSASLIGCATKPTYSTTQVSKDGYAEINADAIPDAVPRHEPKSKYGNPKSYHVLGKTYYVEDSAHGFRERGQASWYGHPFHGRRTSSGETYDMYLMTAAHKTIPIPSYMRVTNLDNGKSIVVRVNDRGPFHQGRVIDLSYAAAKKLGVHSQGTAPVEIAVVTPTQDHMPPAHRPQRPPMMAAHTEAPSLRPAAHAPAAPMATQQTASYQQAYLQIAAFNSKPRAQEMANHLQQIPQVPGIKIESGYSNNIPVHRVQVGPFNSASFAQQFSSTISQLYPDVSPVVITR